MARKPALYIGLRESSKMPATALFTLSVTSGKFGPRTGSLTLDREDGTPVVHTPTPALLTATSRGLVPHLSRDNVHVTGAIQHIQLPFESFLDRNPPVLTIVGGSHPLHQFLGYETDKHVTVLTLRDPEDGRKMPPNGNDFVSAQCTRGVRKVSISAWKTYVQKCKPDLVVALSDIPFTPPPHSQKRLTKSIERSVSWLADFLRLPADPDENRPRHVFVHLVGGAEAHARGEFADRLTEPIEQKDAVGLSPFNTLDDGVAGYVVDLLPLHTALAAETSRPIEPPSPSPVDELLKVSDSLRSSQDSSGRLAELIQASLDPLPEHKPRMINSPVSPHEILRLVRDIGIDLVDGFWAQRAADIGVAFDFRFPIASLVSSDCPAPRTREGGKIDLGHNLFDSMYRHDHTRLASCFSDGFSAEQSASSNDLPVCSCHACSPRSPAVRLLHSSVDFQAWQDSQKPLPSSSLRPPFVRSYIHHLLHTHEMSSHSLLTMHNLTVLSSFLDGIREVLARDSPRDEFEKELVLFEQTYDEDMVLWDEAAAMWLDVEHARGKGRLAREREKQATSTMGTAVEI